MKKKNHTKKELKRIKKKLDSDFNNKRKKKEPDLWKEIRSNLKPLSKAYNKFKEKRRILKQKEEERRLKEEEKQRLREEEAIKLQEQEEKRIQKEKKIKRDEEIRLAAQEKQRLEEKRIKEERNEQIKQEQIYRKRLILAEEERLKQLKRVNELREEERKIKEERGLKIQGSVVNEEIVKNEEQQIIKDEKERLRKEEQRLKEKEKKLKDEEQRLKEEQKRIKEEEITISKEVRGSDDEKNKKRLNGTVKWYSADKGYGFIKREDKERDIFVHSTAIQDSGLKYLKKDEQLTFEVDYTDKGLSAINLQKTVIEVSRSHLKVVK